MFRNGKFVWNHVKPWYFFGKDDYEINPTGVDITLGSVLHIGSGRLTMLKSGSATPRKVELRSTESKDGLNVYDVEPGYYEVKYNEVITIPDGHIGFILPRSTLMRNGVMLHTAVWDAGYEGEGSGGLSVHHPFTVEQGTRIGQLVLAKAEDSSISYDGQYQGEGT